jgi:23S rRNA 5-hydroxycytidine C2501 synthase
MTTPLELLAPAGNAEIGIAAIDHGADAVYIGAPKFSARAEAGVSVADIARLIYHAHLYYARVYVALNTILTDQELPEALEMIREVFRLGADGLIVQDVGLLELDLPPIPLIASTQMHNNSAEKVRFLEAAGFKRVILARELSLHEITAIRQKTRIEMETFVHGALCVSYSGQCYMSQAATGRSGNRGTCAQPCRSLYTLTDADGAAIRQKKFLLSLKDLNLMNAIPDLIAAGVTSFKIEGRYKGIDYVKNVTAAYRQVIDRFISGHPDYCRSSSGVSEFSFSPDPERTFNRGYTRYFVSGKREKVASIDTQKSIGQYAGAISSLGKDFFTIGEHDLHNGDGLCFFTKQRDLAGFRIERVDKKNIYPNKMKGLEVGVRLYRNHNTVFIHTLKKSLAHRRIAVKMTFIQEDTLVRLIARDEDGNEAFAIREVLFDPPRDPSRALEQVETHLSSAGNSPYRVARLAIHPRQPGFFPLSVLNGIRRDVLETLTRIRIEKYPRQIIPFTVNNAPYPEKRLDYRANVLNEKARRFYERHGAEIIEPAFETLPDTIGKTVMTSRYCIRNQLDLCPRDNPGRPPKEPLIITDGHHKYRLEFDCRQCRMFVILEER